MFQKIHTFLILILAFFAGFFPYMPLAHADFSVQRDHQRSHCGTMSTTDNTPHEHPMRECLNIINEVYFSASGFSEIFLSIVVFSIFLFCKRNTEQKIPRKIISRSISPPRYFLESYIGIIKITT